MNVTEEFRSVRDQLLELRQDDAQSREEFSWPQFAHFNFGYNWFVQVALDPQRGRQCALIITELDGSSTRRTWKELARRSTQLARWLSDQGVKRSDCIAMLLGNQVELWETLLAGIKLGAILVPCTTQLTSADPEDRLERGEVA